MRRGSIVQLLILGVIAGAIATAIAYFIPWMPKSASKEFDRIEFTIWVATVISLFVFAIVAAVLTYALLKFRVKEGDLSDGPPVHGHTMLEVVWTAVPVFLVGIIIVVSTIVLAQNSNAGDNPLRVKVLGMQFAWQFTYPNDKTYPILRLPVDRSVELEITGQDVIHSFWVPEFAQKMDAVPGAVNKLVITPTRTGTFPVICTELCGLGHALMRSEAVVMSQDDYEAWYEGESQPAAPAGGGAEEAGLETFNQAGCGACHTFAAAGATGKVGPSLDRLSEAADAAGMPLEAFIHESIVEPDAYVAEGFQPGTMPSFAGQIPDERLDQLVTYLAENTQ